MAKKQPEAAPDYGSFDSYQLTDEQVRLAVEHFQFDFLNDSGDDKAGVFLALLHSFTFTTDSARRETMLLAAESALAPFTSAFDKAMKSLATGSHKQLVQAGGTQ